MPGKTLSVAIICQDEAQTLPYTLHCIETVLGPYLADVVIVDGGSEDNTVEVIESWMGRLPLVLLHHPYDTPGKQKNRGLERCSGEWVLAIDADHTFGTNLGLVYESGFFGGHEIWDFLVYVCAKDEYHSYNKREGPGGPLGRTTRMFRSSYRYLHDYHEQVWDSRTRSKIGVCGHVPIFEHCLLQSQSALRQRGIRWQPHATEMHKRGHGPGGPDRYEYAAQFTAENCVPLPGNIRALVLPRDLPVLRRLDHYRIHGDYGDPPPLELWGD